MTEEHTQERQEDSRVWTSVIAATQLAFNFILDEIEKNILSVHIKLNKQLPFDAKTINA